MQRVKKIQQQNLSLNNASPLGDKLFLGTLAVLIFLIPTNLFAKLPYSGVIVSGITIDYLLPKFFLSDIVALFVIILSWRFFSKKMLHILFVVGVFAVTHLFLHRYDLTLPSIAWMLLKWFEIITLAFVLIERRALLNHPWITRAIALTIVFQTMLGGYQFALQRSFIGFKFFGEPSFSNASLLVKSELPGVVRILPYGTTPHPNILAGVVVVMFFLLMLQASKSLLTQLSGVCALLLALTTQSDSALYALFFGFIIFVFVNSDKWKMKTKTWIVIATSAAIVTLSPYALASLAPQLPLSSSITRRVQLNSMGVRAFLAHPVEGTGLNAFTAVEHAYGEVPTTIRFAQPIHHIPLLFLTETGIVGLIFLVLFLCIVHKYYSPIFSSCVVFSVPIAIIFSLDHYVYSLQQGHLMFAFILAFLLEKRGMNKPTVKSVWYERNQDFRLE